MTDQVVSTRIDWVREHSRLLLAISAEFRQTRPFDGLTIGTGIHLEAKTVALLLTLRDGGARLVSTGNLNTTLPEAVEALPGGGHRTPVPAETLDPPGVVASYKGVASLERDFRSIKADDLDLRPIWHRLEDRVKAHVLICTLACYLTWHLRKAWAPLTFTDEHPPQRENPVAPARRSPSTQAKASRKTGPGRQRVRSFRDVLGHLPPRPGTSCATGRRSCPPSPSPPPISGAPSTSSTPQYP